MSSNKNYKVPEQFENIFKIVSSPRFINKEGLGGNRAVFIHPYPISKQVDFELHYNFLLKRLEQNNTAILSIDLYKICISILESKGILFKIFEFEQEQLLVLEGGIDVFNLGHSNRIVCVHWKFHS